MQTTIHLVRHCQVENPSNIAYGRMPGFHLSKGGGEKAKKVGEFFKGKNISIIYTSPLERAFETANIISDFLSKDVKIIHKYELIEIDASKWQSFSLSELFQNKYFEAFMSDLQSSKVPENLSALANRMEKFTLKLGEIDKGREIICVSHEYPILALRLKLEGKPLTQLKDNYADLGSVTTFVFEEDWTLREVSYTEIR